MQRQQLILQHWYAHCCKTDCEPRVNISEEAADWFIINTSLRRGEISRGGRKEGGRGEEGGGGGGGRGERREGHANCAQQPCYTVHALVMPNPRNDIQSARKKAKAQTKSGKHNSAQSPTWLPH